MTKERLSPSTVLTIPLLERIIVGIGEVSDITGVSPRQLRYWETKGIIQSLGGAAAPNRKYDYANMEKIILIKDYLDQGYTLEAAAKRQEERIQHYNAAMKRLSETVHRQNAAGATTYCTPDGQEYLFVATAIHSKTKETLLLYAPLDDTDGNLLAVPQE